LIAVESVGVRADQEEEEKEDQSQNEEDKTTSQEESGEIINYEVKLSANYYKK